MQQDFRTEAPPLYILKTIDAGATWTITGTGFYLFGLSFTSPETGFGVGLNGLIIATTDGGMSWTELGTPREEDLWNVSFYDADTGYAVGGYDGMRSIILKTTDGGATWHEQFIPSNYPLYAIATTGNSAFTGGLYCNLFGTTNGGIGVSSGPLADLREHFISVFPDPASSVITIETPYPGQLYILNLSGQVLLTCQVTEPKSLVDISNLPGGVYVVRLVGDKGMQVGKFVKN